MSPALAFVVCCGAMVWLFRQDLKLRRLPSPSLWVPALWIAVLGSRPISYWVRLLGFQAGATSSQEGSPLDHAVLLTLILSAMAVLGQRGFRWDWFVQQNKVMIVLYLYLATSALWAVDTFPTIRRVIKDFGGIPVALVFLTLNNPLDGIRIVFTRVSYILFPFSLLFIKYFPEIGRVPSRGGSYLFCGVTDHKNTLGLMVFVFSLMIVLDLLEIRRVKVGRGNGLHEWIRYGMLILGVWLLLVCDSMTSLLCLLLSCTMLWWTGRLQHMANPRAMVLRWLGVIAGAGLIDVAFNFSGWILALLGRNATLTGRTEIWTMVKEHAGSLLGSGYFSYWSTPGAQDISALYLGTLNSAHNGYLEMLLDGGVIGLSLLILLLLVWGRNTLTALLDGTLFGRVKLVLWTVALTYNYSETSFFRMEPLWFTLLLTMVVVPGKLSGRFPTVHTIGSQSPYSRNNASPARAE